MSLWRYSSFNLIYEALFVLCIFAFLSCGKVQTGVPQVPTELRPGEAHIPLPRKGHRFRVDLLTVEPGEEIYSAWGHTALRILDTEKGIDVVFDYGLFDFSPTFWARFLMGKPAFKVGAFSTLGTVQRYRNDNRRIFAQEIRLSDKEAGMLLEKLKINLLPQNRTFLYHHYADNCTTRVRDRINESLHGGLHSYFAGKGSSTNYRKASMHLLLGRPWLWFGTNLILGSTVERPIDRWQEQFLPLLLLHALEEYRKAGHETEIGPVQILLEPVSGGFQIQLASWIGFAVVLGFSLVIFFVIPILWPQKKSSKVLSVFGYLGWHLAAGLCGLGLSLAWAFTNHDTVFWNLNLLGYSPLLLAVPILHFFLQKKFPDTDLLLHRFLVALPLLGALMSLLGLVQQFAWPFLFLAALVQALIYLFLGRTHKFC